jgi:hypothetical protein
MKRDNDLAKARRVLREMSDVALTTLDAVDGDSIATPHERAEQIRIGAAIVRAVHPGEYGDRLAGALEVKAVLIVRGSTEVPQ